jgi:NADH-quinone oxidoreductase subunit G
MGVLAGPMASKQLFDAVPFYNGLTLDEIAGRGVRWPERATYEIDAWEPVKLDVPAVPAARDGALRLGTWRSLWSSKEVEVSPVLKFMRPRQMVELSPADAQALGINDGDRVEVAANGTKVRGAVRLRASVPGGSVFLTEGTHEEPANALTAPFVEVRRIAGPSAPESSAVGVLSTPAGEGHGEMPPSAPLDIPPVQPPSQSGEGRP